MPNYLLQHRHEPHECGIAFAAFRGPDSALRQRTVLASCRWGEHAIWCAVEAGSEDEALGQLPYFVAQRTTVTRVCDVLIP